MNRVKVTPMSFLHRFIKITASTHRRVRVTELSMVISGEKWRSPDW